MQKRQVDRLQTKTYLSGQKSEWPAEHPRLHLSYPLKASTHVEIYLKSEKLETRLDQSQTAQ